MAKENSLFNGKAKNGTAPTFTPAPETEPSQAERDLQILKEADEIKKDAERFKAVKAIANFHIQ